MARKKRPSLESLYMTFPLPFAGEQVFVATVSFDELPVFLYGVAAAVVKPEAHRLTARTNTHPCLTPNPTSLAERAEHEIPVFLAGVAVITLRLRVRPDGTIRAAIFQEDLEAPAASVGKPLAVLVHDGEIAALTFQCDAVFRLNLQQVVYDDGAVRETPALVPFHSLVVGVNVVQPACELVIGAFGAGQPAPDVCPAPVAFWIRDFFRRFVFNRSSPAKRSDGRE